MTNQYYMQEFQSQFKFSKCFQLQQLVQKSRIASNKQKKLAKYLQKIEMQLAIDQILKKEQQQLDGINQQLKLRAQKFGSEFLPINLSDYKLYRIQKASQTGKMEYLEGILLQDIQDLQERKKRIKERTEKFFPNIKVQADNNKFFNKREDPDFTEDNTTIRYNAWYLFGVDYMSNERIRNYFHENPHFKIQWINDSACNICFQTKQQAEEAIKPHIKGDSMTDQKQTIWYQLKQYEVEGVRRKLFCRLATNKDSKVTGTHGHDSKYYRWEINKQKINSFVKKKASQYINKQKKIKKHNVQVNQTKFQAKKQQEQDSSSGVNDSENQMKEDPPA